MEENKILKQITTIFSIFMVFFYFGVGAYLLFYLDQSYIDKSTRTIIGSAFMLYGVYRTFRAVIQIKEVFFSKETDDE